MVKNRKLFNCFGLFGQSTGHRELKFHIVTYHTNIHNFGFISLCISKAIILFCVPLHYKYFWRCDSSVKNIFRQCDIFDFFRQCVYSAL